MDRADVDIAAPLEQVGIVGIVVLRAILLVIIEIAAASARPDAFSLLYVGGLKSLVTFVILDIKGA